MFAVVQVIDKHKLQTLEQYWLAKSVFLAGDEISVADLLHCCELDQLCLLDGAEQVIAQHPVCYSSSASVLAQCIVQMAGHV